jgi:hypothetical protein
LNDSLRVLHAAPFAAGQILGHFTNPIRLDVQAIQIVDDDIRPRPFGQHSSIAETGRVCRQGRKAIVHLFERHARFVPNHPAQKVGSEGATSKQLRMRAAVGNAGKVYIDPLMISALNSALNCGSAWRNSAFKSVASDRSIITSVIFAMGSLRMHLVGSRTLSSV